MSTADYWHSTNESRGGTLSGTKPLVKEDAAMTTAPTTHHLTVPAAKPALTGLVAAVRKAIDVRASWAHTAQLVADQLRAHLPDANVLAPDQRRGNPDRPAGHLLHAEPDGTFSILGLVWRPGQSTRIHDHITWCVVGVLRAPSTKNCSTQRSTPSVNGTTTRARSAASHRQATSTASETTRARPPSACTSTAPTSPGSGPAPAA